MGLVVASSVLALCQVARAAEVEQFWPVDTDWARSGLIVSGPDEAVGKRLEELPQWFDIKGDTITAVPAAPPGEYRIEWEAPHPPAVSAAELSLRLYKANENEWSFAGAYGDGRFANEWRQRLDGGGDDLVWLTDRDYVWPIAEDEPIRLVWRFYEPHEGEIWIVKLADPQLRATDPDAAKRVLLRPVVEGLPPLADPLATIRPWTSEITLHDGMLLKDGQLAFVLSIMAS